MSHLSRFDEYESASVPLAGRVMRHVAVTVAVAAALATVFTAWTPASLSPGELAGQLAEALQSGTGADAINDAGYGFTADEEGLKIGIVVGHAGIHPDTGLVDPGASCTDGLTELEVNQRIAELTAGMLEAAGLKVDLLDEWDSRLFGYRSVALISIHADSCLPINEYATGYKVSTAIETVVLDKAQRLIACVVARYGRSTDLRYHPGSITRDMTEYHTFKEIHTQTPAVIIEAGFMNLDRDLLTETPEKSARGIAEGVLCYVKNEPADLTGGGQP